MGGCRCSYRNCSVRTDGSTHMFHYPVFDKLRCHQWLTNAQKHNFLNLKVSQLKNRVICQHHFKDEHFMNFKKDKLTFDAIPTLNGPFCEPDTVTDNNISQDEPKMYPISLDDIETEYLTLSDKKANFSVKYGDFLTNSEVMDMNTINISSNNTNKTPVLVKDKQKKSNIAVHSVINLSENINVLQNSTTINILPNEVINFQENNQTKPGELSEPGIIFVEPTTIPIEYVQLNPGLHKPETRNSKNNNGNQTENGTKDQSSNSQCQSVFPRKQRVKILSQKNLSQPVPIVGKLEPVSPSLILRLPEKTKKINSENVTEVNETGNCKVAYIQNNNTKNIQNNNTVKVSSTEDVINEQPIKKAVPIRQNDTKNTINTGISSKKSLLKPRIKQDRIEAIEEKRKFNLKLRDIIESCLDKIDDQDKPIKIKPKDNNENIGIFLSEENTLPSVHEYTIACLEARMKRMEDILLKKIDQNTQRIVELKNSISTSDQKSSSTQTIHNEESHKKQLYKDISKYLSADASNLIYEELFINKYAQITSQNAPTPKRRKRR